MKYLIFDFDGVIADTLAANLQTRINLGFVKTMDEAVQNMNNYFDNKPKHTRDHTLSPTDLTLNYETPFSHTFFNTKKSLSFLK